MNAGGQLLYPIAASSAMSCIGFQAGFSSCVESSQLNAAAFNASSYHRCDSLISSASQALISYKSVRSNYAFAQAEPRTQDYDVGDMAIILSVMLLSTMIVLGALSTIGHYVRGPRATWLNIPYKGDNQKQGVMRWTIFGLALFQQWLQEKIVAACTLGMPSETKAVAREADVEQKGLQIPQLIHTLQRLIPIHQSLMKKGWQSYEKLSTSKRLKSLMSFLKCQGALDAQDIKVITLPVAILKLRHKDGREKQIELSELGSYADSGTSGSVQIFVELFNLQTSDEWYANWCELFSNKALSELSIRIAEGETAIEIDDDNIASVSVEHDLSFVRLRHEYDHFDFDPSDLDDIAAQIELLEEYDGLLDQVEDIPSAEKADAAKMRFAYLITRHLNGKNEKAPKASPFLFSASELQELIKQNQEFFDSIEWEDIPRQVRKAMSSMRKDSERG